VLRITLISIENNIDVVKKIKTTEKSTVTLKNFVLLIIIHHSPHQDPVKYYKGGLSQIADSPHCSLKTRNKNKLLGVNPTFVQPGIKVIGELHPTTL